MAIKALQIAEALYPNYLLVFLFDNATSYSIHAKNKLYIKDINKSLEGNNHIWAMVGIKKIVLIKYIQCIFKRLTRHELKKEYK